MATGRTHSKFARIYFDGFDISGHTRSVGELGTTVEPATDAAWADSVHSTILGQPEVVAGPINAIFSNTATTGIHAVAKTSGGVRNLMIPLGIQAAPADNDEVFGTASDQLAYKVSGGDGMVAATIEMGGWSGIAGFTTYDNPWGKLVHAKAAETAVNTGTSTVDYTAQTAKGGWMMYHLFTSDGTDMTIKIQDASTDSNPSFGDLMTSGSLDASSTPKSGIVALSKTATVERYIRWQIIFAGGATTATFALAFMRAIR